MKQTHASLHILTGLNFGGVERRMELLANAHKYTMFDHQFCALGSGGAASEFIKCSGRQVYCLNESVKIPNPRLVYKIAKLIRTVRPTVVHTHGAEANFHGILASAITHVPVRISEEIGIPSHSSVAKRVFKAIYALSDYVIGMSDVVNDALIANKEAPKKKVIRVFNPVSIPMTRDFSNLGPYTIKIAFVGRLESIKNPLGLLKIFKKITSEFDHVELVFIGEGSVKIEIEDYIRTHSLKNKVTVLGYQRQPEKILRKCDLFVQPSITEGFSVALVEAIGMGIPAIATDTGGVREVIRCGQNGWVVKPTDERDLYEALRDACSKTKEELYAMGRIGISIVADRFDPSQYAMKLEELYLKVLEHR